jgi:hypothetical protein
MEEEELPPGDESEGDDELGNQLSRYSRDVDEVGAAARNLLARLDEVRYGQLQPTDDASRVAALWKLAT